MSADPNKKSPRTFQCRDVLWETFEQMARELECSIDYLVNESMKQYARQRSYSPQQQGGQPGGMGGAQRPQYPSQPGGPSTSPPPGMGHAAPGQGYGNNGAAPGYAPPFPGGPQMGGARSTGGPPAPPSTGKRPPSLPAPPPGRPAGPPGAPPPSMRMPPPGAPPGMGPPGMPPQRRSAPPPPPPGMPGGQMSGGQGMSGGYSNPGMQVGAPPPPPPNYYGGGVGNTGAFPPPPPPPNTAYAPPAAPPQQQYAPPPPPPQQAAPAAGSQLTAYYQGQRFVVNKERFIIGRGKQTSDLTIKDPNVSRQHGMVEFINGQYYMVDMGSTNGVEFAGQRISRKAIAEGDLYRICDHEIRFSYR